MEVLQCPTAVIPYSEHQPSMSMPSLRDRRQRTSSRCSDPVKPDDALSFHDLQTATPTRFEPRMTRAPLRISGLYPLSPICASPLCTPTTSICTSKPDGLPTTMPLSNSSSHSADRYLTPPTTPDKETLPCAFHMVPTWIAVPPTPPPRPAFQKSSTSMRRAYSFTPSVSFPSLSALGDSSPFQSPKPRRSVSLSGIEFLSMTDDDPIRRKPIFHLGNNSDEDGSDVAPDSFSHHGAMETLGKPPPDVQDKPGKDDVRKYHALLELLTTEIGYLSDLRTLVKVYLHRVAHLTHKPSVTTSTFPRTSSFTATSRANTVILLHPNPALSCTPVPDTSPPATVKDKVKEKGNTQRIFNDDQIDLLSRNILDILHLHERFVEELRTIVLPLQLPHSFHEADADAVQDLNSDQIHTIIRAVCTKFATESSRFHSYQSFCAGHPEALNLIRKIRTQYSSDWNVFEQECSLFAAFQCEDGGSQESAEMEALASTSTSYLLEKDDNTAAAPSRERAYSLSSAEATTSCQDPPLPLELLIKARSHRLTFVDYMIKPVQRICKYPLMLLQLKSKGDSSSHLDVDVVVESATQAMRHIACSVDEARHRQEIAIQSNLIVSRIAASYAPTYSSSMKPLFSLLSQEFIASLGTCLLAGSVDVIHYQFSSIPKAAKYMGAFLYLGGYLVLVKVRGKAYEPRHWFPLTEFDISDPTQEDTILPCSFRLSSKTHEFELAASCQGEKNIWMAAIHESLRCPPSWSNEPKPSTHYDERGVLISPAETIPAVITAPQPSFEIGKKVASSEEPLAEVASEGSHSRPEPRQRSSSQADVSSTLPRRASSSSVKNIFTTSHEPATMVINRSSASARLFIDQCLQDVISEPCLAARSLAKRHDGELFSAPKLTRTGLPRSNSGLSMSGVSNAARKRLTRHESVRVPRRRSFMESSDGELVVVRSTVRNRGPLSLKWKGADLFTDVPLTSGSLETCESPFPRSQCSSPAASMTSSAIAGSPVLAPLRRPRLQEGAKDTIHSRPSSDVSFNTASGMSGDLPSVPEKVATPDKGKFSTIFKLWTRVPHRRSRSASDYKTMFVDSSAEAVISTSSSTPDSQAPTLPKLEFDSAPILPEQAQINDPLLLDSSLSDYDLKKTFSRSSFRSITMLQRLLGH